MTLPALVDAFWPFVEELGEEAFVYIEGKIAASRAAMATLPPTPIAPEIAAELEAAKKAL